MLGAPFQGLLYARRLQELEWKRLIDGNVVAHANLPAALIASYTRWQVNGSSRIRTPLAL